MPDNPLDLLKMLTGDSAFIRHNYLVYSTGAFTSVDVTGAANVTLTEIQAAHYQIRFFGAITANITVFVPQKEKAYIFTNATTGEFLVTVQPVTSGTGLPVPRGMLLPMTCDGSNVLRYGPGNARVPEGTFHTKESDGVRNTHIHETFYSNTMGTLLIGRHARGTQAIPIGLAAEDRGVTLHGSGWGRNADDTAHEWILFASMRMLVDAVDAEGRLSGGIAFLVSPGASGALVEHMRLNDSGDLLLGEDITSDDKIRLKTSNRNGIDGKHSLTIEAEDGTEHLFGDRARLTRLLNAQSLDFGVLTEETTIAAAAFTDTTFEIPATAVVLGTSIYVTVTIPTATTFDYGIPGATTRYGNDIAVAASTAYDGAGDLPRRYSTATKVRFTPNVTPATNVGRVRVTCHYYMVIPANS